ncbi:MAG: DegT/DnrJ/EryC1/StrS family aminotransferase [Deltaproteobacteria bacterium]|nr:DegT/DnrJ/EryC1/StrS family aminotransferase [Deltaproteobacteria bacterium]
MSEPDIGPAERAAVLAVLDGKTLALGPRLAAFEDRLAARVGARHGIAVNSGTAALHLCLLAAGVGPEDVVVTTPFSFVASANCILYTGARPLFVDVDPVTLTLDPERLERAAQTVGRSGRRVKAVLPVHVFGEAADMDAILAVAERHGLAVIEDACEAIGGAYKGRPLGTLGDAGAFAFYPNKQMTTGEGGMIVTDDARWDALARSLRNQGRDVFDEWLAHTRLGYNYRLDEMSAALGLAQVERLDEILAKRGRVARWYHERLDAMEGVARPRPSAWTTRESWFVYVVRLADLATRAHVMRALAERGIPSRPYFPPIHLQPFYRADFGFREGMFPIAEAAGETCLALPFFGTMTEQQVDTVCGALREVLAAFRPARPGRSRVTAGPTATATAGASGAAGAAEAARA